MKRLALLLFLLPVFSLAQSSQEKCQQNACYGYGPPSGACVGAFIYSDISQTPVQAYSCVAGAWRKQGGSSSTPTPVSGALADYDFLQGSGTTLTDISGSGNTATLGTGALAPTWTSTGLSFLPTNNVTLPTALNASRTFYFAVYLNPLPTSQASFVTNYAYPLLLASSLGSAGLNIVTTYSGDQTQQSQFAVSTVANSNFRTETNSAISGFNVIAMTFGTGSSGDVDHVYLNGVEVESYLNQTYSVGFQTSGNLYLGTSATDIFTTSGFYGMFYRAVFKTTEDSASVVASNSLAILKEIQNRPVVTSPQLVNAGVPLLTAAGDSITYGLGLGNPATQAWPANLVLTNQPAYTIQDYGLIGVGIGAMAGSEANRIAPSCLSSAGPSVVIGFAGTNDLTLSQGLTATPTGAFSHLQAWIQTLKSAGCRVFVGTMLSRTGGIDTKKDAYDSLILSGWKTSGADGVVDFAANPLMGADGAYTNTTYFQSDGTHPTAAGQLLLAAAASNTLNYYFGYNSANPHIVTATYTMLAGDGYVTANPTANAVLTLPDCTGPSGATYTVSNIQSAFTVGVVTGSSAQLINGLATATAVSIPSNSSVVFRDVPNAKTVSGCHWEK